MKSRLLPMALVLGIPQHNADDPAGLKSLIEIVASHPERLGGLSGNGVDLRPLLRMKPEELIAIARTSGANLPRDRTWPQYWTSVSIMINQFIAKDKTAFEQWCQKVFASGALPQKEHFLQDNGRLTPEMRGLLNTGHAADIFSPQRWKGHEKEAREMAQTLLSALAGWQRDEVEKQIDFVQLERNAAAMASVSSLVAGRAAARRQERREQP